MFGKKHKKQLLPKDLLDDLEMTDSIAARVKEQLEHFQKHRESRRRYWEMGFPITTGTSTIASTVNDG